MIPGNHPKPENLSTAAAAASGPVYIAIPQYGRKQKLECSGGPSIETELFGNMSPEARTAIITIGAVGLIIGAGIYLYKKHQAKGRKKRR